MTPEIPSPPDTSPRPLTEQALQPARFKALGDPTRLALFIECACADRGQGCNVSDLAACCTVDLSVVSRHLKILADAGLVDARKQGREVFYSVPAAEVARHLREVADAIEASACGAPGCCNDA